MLPYTTLFVASFLFVGCALDPVIILMSRLYSLTVADMTDD
jgi:hypothetical protein